MYQEQKDIILTLLKKAEKELQNVPVKYSSSKQLEADLNAKKDLKLELKKAIEINLKKLKELSAHIVTIASPDRVEVINKEVG